MLLSVLPNISQWFEEICLFFTNIFVYIISFGNYILFGLFLYLFFTLYKGAKEKERDERFHSYTLPKSRKYGRGGMIICVVLGILFLTRVLITAICHLSVSLPVPFIYDLVGLDSEYAFIQSHPDTKTFGLYPFEQFFVSFLGFICFICFILFIYGTFVLIYNRILHSRVKPINLMIIGGIGLLILGLTILFRIMDGLDFLIRQDYY